MNKIHPINSFVMTSAIFKWLKKYTGVQIYWKWSTLKYCSTLKIIFQVFENFFQELCLSITKYALKILVLFFLQAYLIYPKPNHLIQTKNRYEPLFYSAMGKGYLDRFFLIYRNPSRGLNVRDGSKALPLSWEPDFNQIQGYILIWK